MNRKLFIQITKRSVLNINMFLILFFSIIVLLHELIINEGYLVYWESVNKIDSLSIIENVYALSIYTQIVGMFPGCPFSYTLLNEKNSGYIDYMLIRRENAGYINDKIFGAIISGMLSTGLPYLVIVFLAIIGGGPTTPDNHNQVMNDLVWGKLLYQNNGMIVIVLKGVLLMLFGILWAELSLLISVVVRNKYLGYILPYLIYELLFFLNWRDGILITINPRYMIRYDVSSHYSLISPFILFLIYIIIVVIFIKFIFKRYVNYEKNY